MLLAAFVQQRPATMIRKYGDSYAKILLGWREVQISINTRQTPLDGLIHLVLIIEMYSGMP
jgi:hypothetical protein